MQVQHYKYGLAVTSQFYFCGLPLRLDSYSNCAFRCSYCFAHARGGANRDATVSVYSADRLAQRFERIRTKGPVGAIDELLAHGQPVHFGGMTDPFSPLEARHGASLELLKVLADNGHPTVISTKSDTLGQDTYLNILKRGKFVIQVSLSSMDPSLIANVDRGTPGPKRLMAMLKTLSVEGVPTACRIQPILPTAEAHAVEVLSACGEVGVRHVAAEHLKLGVEKDWQGTRELGSTLKLNLLKYFVDKRASRVGREWVMNVDHRLERILDLRRRARARKMTFGAADTDLLLFSDGGCCCSGVGAINGFTNYFRHNYLEAVRVGLSTGSVSIDSLAGSWVPKGSIAEHVNSNSRMNTRHGKGAGVARYITRNWNGAPNGADPKALYGVFDSGEKDRNGLKIYSIDDKVRQLALS